MIKIVIWSYTDSRGRASWGARMEGVGDARYGPSAAEAVGLLLLQCGVEHGVVLVTQIESDPQYSGRTDEQREPLGPLPGQPE